MYALYVLLILPYATAGCLTSTSSDSLNSIEAMDIADYHKCSVSELMAVDAVLQRHINALVEGARKGRMPVEIVADYSVLGALKGSLALARQALEEKRKN
jgi:hypothetical protein